MILHVTLKGVNKRFPHKSALSPHFNIYILYIKYLLLSIHKLIFHHIWSVVSLGQSHILRLLITYNSSCKYKSKNILIIIRHQFWKQWFEYSFAWINETIYEKWYLIHCDKSSTWIYVSPWLSCSELDTCFDSQTIRKWMQDEVFFNDTCQFQYRLLFPFELIA